MVGSVKDKIMGLIIANIVKNHRKPTPVNNIHGGQKKLRKPKIKNNQRTK